jgi:hypothetical protein
MPNSGTPSWRRASNQKASGRPGAVQRVPNGQSPDQIVQARLEAKPELANPAYQPPGPCDRTKIKVAAQRTVYSAKDVSHPDN